MRPRSVAFYDREPDRGFGNSGDSYDFTGGHPPHEVYFEFPEYKEDVTEGPITSVFGGKHDRQLRLHRICTLVC